MRGMRRPSEGLFFATPANGFKLCSRFTGHVLLRWSGGFIVFRGTKVGEGGILKTGRVPSGVL